MRAGDLDRLLPQAQADGVVGVFLVPAVFRQLFQKLVAQLKPDNLLDLRHKLVVLRLGGTAVGNLLAETGSRMGDFFVIPKQRGE